MPKDGNMCAFVSQCAGKDIKVKKSKNEQKPTRNEETSDQEKDLKPISKAGSRPWSRKDKKSPSDNGQKGEDVTKMILFATYYVWWHGMEQDVEDFKGNLKLRGRLFHSWKIRFEDEDC
ncbi:hypothetical protein Tco_0123775 [Tanacetum coccineum]